MSNSTAPDVGALEPETARLLLQGLTPEKRRFVVEALALLQRGLGFPTQVRRFYWMVSVYVPVMPGEVDGLRAVTM